MLGWLSQQARGTEYEFRSSVAQGSKVYPVTSSCGPRRKGGGMRELIFAGRDQGATRPKS